MVKFQTTEDKLVAVYSSRDEDAINIYFMRGWVQDTDILVEAPPGHRKTFLLLTFTLIIFFSLFLSFMQ